MTDALLIVKEYVPGIYDKLPTIKVGDRAIPKGRDSFTVTDSNGKVKGVYPRSVIKRISRHIAPAVNIQTLHQILGAELAKARKYRELTQEAFGLLIGASRQYVNGLEHGRESCSLERYAECFAILDYSISGFKIKRNK